MIKTLIKAIVVLAFIGWVASVGPTGAIQAIVGLGIVIYHLVPGIYHTVGSIAHSVLGTNQNKLTP